MPPSQIVEPQIVEPTAKNIETAAQILRNGGLVAFPTETVYGLGADATNDRAVAAVFAAKDRPRFNPLIVHLASAIGASRIVRFDKRVEKLARACWPGPLTLVLPRRKETCVSRLAGAGLDTLAVRVPDHKVAQALLAATRRPIVAPSANCSGRLSPTRAAHVIASLGKNVDLVLDGGPCRIGLESTVLDLTEEPRILREGAITAARLAKIIGEPVAETGAETTQQIRSPGMLARHYAPGRPLRLDADKARPGEALLAFGADAPPESSSVKNLSPSGDLTEAAANLYRFLHELDREEFSTIAVCPIPDSGLGRAINDRLRRAAQPIEASHAAAS
jgi:L-threonylcarbamoyladenylate synthase